MTVNAARCLVLPRMLSSRAALLRPILLKKIETTPSSCFGFWSERSQAHSFSFFSTKTLDAIPVTAAEFRNARRIYGFAAPQTVIPGGQFQRNSCEARVHSNFGSPCRHTFHRLTLSSTSRSVSAAMSSTAASPVPPSNQSTDYSYLKQAEAQAIDDELMGPLGFSIDQLMVRYGERTFCYNAHRPVLVSCHLCLYIESPITKQAHYNGDDLRSKAMLHFSRMKCVT